MTFVLISLFIYTYICEFLVSLRVDILRLEDRLYFALLRTHQTCCHVIAVDEAFLHFL